jgi:hypothetical protein
MTLQAGMIPSQGTRTMEFGNVEPTISGLALGTGTACVDNAPPRIYDE